MDHDAAHRGTNALHVVEEVAVLGALVRRHLDVDTGGGIVVVGHFVNVVACVAQVGRVGVDDNGFLGGLVSCLLLGVVDTGKDGHLLCSGGAASGGFVLEVEGHAGLQGFHEGFLHFCKVFWFLFLVVVCFVAYMAFTLATTLSKYDLCAASRGSQTPAETLL